MLAGHITVGFPRMHREASERRDFLPPLIGLLAANGAEVYLETGIGSGMGYSDTDYSAVSPAVHITNEEDCYRQDIVVVLRAPEGRYQLLRPGAELVSMLHFATRPGRVAMLGELGIDALSLDLIRNEDGRRLVENLRSVAWNGVAAAFAALERTWPNLRNPHRSTVKVTILGAGRVGRHAVEFATKYGDDARNEAFGRIGLPGVEVVTVGRNLTGDAGYLKGRLAVTDVLVDATARRDPSAPIVPNAWIAILPDHAVICDLAVDPYLLDNQPPIVRGIEGIPRATWINGSSRRTTPRGTRFRPASRRANGGPWSPATRGRASGPNRACTFTDPSSLRSWSAWSRPAAWTASGPMGPTSSRHLRAEASATGASHQDRWRRSSRPGSAPDRLAPGGRRIGDLGAKTGDRRPRL